MEWLWIGLGALVVVGGLGATLYWTVAEARTAWRLPPPPAEAPGPSPPSGGTD